MMDEPELSPEQNSELEFLTAERERLYSKVNAILTNAGNLTKQNFHFFQGTIVVKLPKIEDEFEKLQRDIIRFNISIPDALRAKRLEVQQVQSDFDKLTNTIRNSYYKFIEAPSASAQPVMQGPSAPAVLPSATHVTLPRLELPKFDGQLTNWSAFYSVFQTSVVSNPTLDNIERFQYLLTVLSGPALDMIKTVPLTAANFTVAWNLLVTRFASERRHIFFHMKNLLK